MQLPAAVILPMKFNEGFVRKSEQTKDIKKISKLLI